MNITFNAPDKGGSVSEVSWHNRDLQSMLERFFGPRANERLIEINVMERGIRAYFEFIERPFPEVAAKMEAKKA